MMAARGARAAYELKTNGNKECSSETYSPSGCHDTPHALRSSRCEKVRRLHLEAFTLKCSDLEHSPWSRVMYAPVLTSRDPDCCGRHALQHAA